MHSVDTIMKLICIMAFLFHYVAACLICCGKIYTIICTYSYQPQNKYTMYTTITQYYVG